MRAFARGAVINRDDNLHLEFSSPLAVGAGVRSAILQALYRVQRGRALAPWEESNTEVFRHYQRAKFLTVRAERDLTQPNLKPRAERQLREVLRALPDYGPARIQLAGMLGQRSLRQLGSGHSSAALKIAREALALMPDEAGRAPGERARADAAGAS